eukprot:2957740-Ditylum_brightwellii.AAC.1
MPTSLNPAQGLAFLSPGRALAWFQSSQLDTSHQNWVVGPILALLCPAENLVCLQCDLFFLSPHKVILHWALWPASNTDHGGR